MQEKLRALPSVDSLMRLDRMSSYIEDYTYDRVKDTVQATIDDVRSRILSGEEMTVSDEGILQEVAAQLDEFDRSSLRPVINATGTVLHTNLGRALLSDSAIQAMHQVAMDYNNLEYDIEAGRRGSRYGHLESIVKTLTGAEAALVVNNNAAAVTLILTALTQGKEVLISRGELVEIGGSFRIPDVITSGGATLHEVGSTNKTHLRDYQVGINEETGAILRVHTSNYRLVGFTDKVDDQDLVELAHTHDIPAINDLGSGLLIDLTPLGLSYEPTVKEMIDCGYDVVSFSGDKLLGGPQAGIIVGKQEYIDILKRHPLLRALRTDKATIAALEATLRHYLNPTQAMEDIPTLRMIGTPLPSLRQRAESLAQRLHKLEGLRVEIQEGTSQVGGGAYPGEYMPTWLVAIRHDHFDEAMIERHLRLGLYHIIARIHEGWIQFDVRTLTEPQFEAIYDALKQCVSNT